MIKLKNYMEEIVDRYIDKVIRDMNICKCKRCKLDITAIALNSLPAKYVVTKKGENYSKLDLLAQQFEIDVITALTKAAKLVDENPRH